VAVFHHRGRPILLRADGDRRAWRRLSGDSWRRRDDAWILLLYQDVFRHWESWAYAWALLPTAAGGGMVLAGKWSDDSRLTHIGLQLATIGFLLFAAGAFFFELVIGIGGFRTGPLGAVLLPAILIGLGLYLVFHRSGRDSSRVRHTGLTTHRKSG
jgi:hypothetical protein